MSRSNHELEQAVRAELHWDPRLDDALIVVLAQGGLVRLSGTVGTFEEKREAEHATERVHGVREVVNDLGVRLATKHVEVEVSPPEAKVVDVDAPVKKVLRKLKRAADDHPVVDDF